MKIAIIAAMEQEIAQLRENLQHRQTVQHAQSQLYTGTLHGIDVVLLQSGIGKVAAAVGTAQLLQTYQPDFVINTGSAGGLAADIAVGDVVISKEVRYHDVDVTAFGYAAGQMAGQPAAFVADDKLVALALAALDRLRVDDQAKGMAHQAIKGLICTGDAFVHQAEQQQQIRQHFPEVIAVEMEAAAIAQTCHQFATPFVVVRAISDVADKDSPMSFEDFLPLAATHSTQMVMEMLKHASQLA